MKKEYYYDTTCVKQSASDEKVKNGRKKVKFGVWNVSMPYIQDFGICTPIFPHLKAIPFIFGPYFSLRP